MKPTRGFASDNNAGIHPEVLEAIARSNEGHTLAYGADPHTEAAVGKFRKHFGPEVEVAFVFNGTGANVLGLRALTDSFHGIICAETAHIQADECGAPEKHTGCKLIPIATPDGKLTPRLVEPHYRGIGDEHHVQPRVISISQTTELGTVYTGAEVRALADFAHQRKMYLHMDGARISNAAASLSIGLKEITGDAGVDVLSFGGTKNGLLVGEAVVFFKPELARNIKFLRKQEMQLASKMRFIAAQFEALLGGDLWLRNARHANQMARLLAERAVSVPGIELARPVEANAVFVRIPKHAIARIQKEFHFYVWNETLGEARWMTSFDTTERDIDAFIQVVRQVVRESTA